MKKAIANAIIHHAHTSVNGILIRLPVQDIPSVAPLEEIRDILSAMSLGLSTTLVWKHYLEHGIKLLDQCKVLLDYDGDTYQHFNNYICDILSALKAILECEDPVQFSPTQHCQTHMLVKWDKEGMAIQFSYYKDEPIFEMVIDHQFDIYNHWVINPKRKVPMSYKRGMGRYANMVLNVFGPCQGKMTEQHTPMILAMFYLYYHGEFSHRALDKGTLHFLDKINLKWGMYSAWLQGFWKK